jgi:hypothetical protein
MLKSHVSLYASIAESRCQQKAEKLRTKKARGTLQISHAKALQTSKAGEVGQQAESASGRRAFGTGSSVHFEDRIRKASGWLHRTGTLRTNLWKATIVFLHIAPNSLTHHPLVLAFSHGTRRAPAIGIAGKELRSSRNLNKLRYLYWKTALDTVYRMAFPDDTAAPEPHLTGQAG